MFSLSGNFRKINKNDLFKKIENELYKNPQNLGKIQIFAQKSNAYS
jgi:hypothetical protein